MRVAVIGAGVAGLSCARALDARGFEVDVVDKGRGPGGRTSSRRHDDDSYDHGAAYFTVRDARFRRCVEELERDGWVARWDARFGVAGAGETPHPDERQDPRWVGAPRMSALARGLAEGLSVTTACRVSAIRGAAQAWYLDREGAPSLGPFERVVSSAPAPQTHTLLAGRGPAAQVDAAELAPCWALMITLGAPLNLSFDALRLDGGPISWLARESSKPGRPAGHRWVVHASPDATETHLESSKEAMAARMTNDLRALVGELPEVRRAVAHRWRYARVTRPVGEDALFDEASGLGACGDWCRGARIEEAFLSGLAMAERIAA